MSNAEAYRQAYDANGSKKTSMEAASRLMADSKVTAMVESIYAKKERVLLDRAVDHRRLVLDRLEIAIDDDDFGVNRLRALGLLADVTGMKRTGLDVTQGDSRSSESILADLEKKLAALGLGETPNAGTTIDHDSIIDHDDNIDHDTVIESDETLDPTRH
jgi:hypothetical protein